MRHPGATGPVQGPPQSNQEEAGVGDGFSLLLSEGMVVVYANSLKPSPIASLAPSRLPQSWWAGSSCLEEGCLQRSGRHFYRLGLGEYYVQFVRR